MHLATSLDMGLSDTLYPLGNVLRYAATLNVSFRLNRRDTQERELRERASLICSWRLCFTSLRNRRRWALIPEALLLIKRGAMPVLCASGTLWPKDGAR